MMPLKLIFCVLGLSLICPVVSTANIVLDTKAYLKWLREKHIRLHPNVSIARVPHGLGIVANGRVKAGDALVRLPAQSVISSASLTTRVHNITRMLVRSNGTPPGPCVSVALALVWEICLLLLVAPHADARGYTGHRTYVEATSSWGPYIKLLLDSTTGHAGSNRHGSGGGREWPHRDRLLLQLNAWHKARDTSAMRRLSLLRRTAPGAALVWANLVEREQKTSEYVGKELARAGWWQEAIMHLGAATHSPGNGDDGTSREIHTMPNVTFALLFRWAAYIVGSRSVSSVGTEAGECTLVPTADLLNHRAGVPKPELLRARPAVLAHKLDYELVLGVGQSTAPRNYVEIFDDYDGGSFAHTGERKCLVDMLHRYNFIPIASVPAGHTNNVTAIDNEIEVGVGIANDDGLRWSDQLVDDSLDDVAISERGRDCWMLEVELSASTAATAAAVGARFDVAGGAFTVHVSANGRPRWPQSLLQALRFALATPQELRDTKTLERAFAGKASTGTRAEQDVIGNTAGCITLRNERSVLELLDGALVQAIHWHSAKRNANSRTNVNSDEYTDKEQWEANAIGASEHQAVRAAHEQVREALLLANRFGHHNSTAAKAVQTLPYSLAWIFMQCAAEIEIRDKRKRGAIV